MSEKETKLNALNELSNFFKNSNVVKVEIDSLTQTITIFWTDDSKKDISYLEGMFSNVDRLLTAFEFIRASSPNSRNYRVKYKRNCN
ncbi:MAG: hypothetical protein KAT32_04845 [Candidatus Moranbacteria bacterium]|nr:hypothetical protein [Candidatus Moranbacteria bacterium]